MRRRLEFLIARVFISLSILLNLINSSFAAPLSLEDCYRQVVAGRETLEQREADISAAQARYDQAVAELFPRLAVNTNRRYRDNAAFGSLNRGGFSDPSTGLPPTRLLGKSQYEVTINLTQPLFRGFREYAIARASTAERASIAQLLLRDKQLLYLDVADLYYQQLLYQDQVTALARSQQTLKLRVTELKEFIQLGKSKESELFAAEAELAQQNVTKEQTKRALAATQEVLSSLMKSPGIMIELAPIQLPTEIPNIDQLLSMIKSRADIQARVESERMISELITAEQRNWWPTIDLDLTSIQVDDPNRNRDWEALMRMSIPIFDGGRISSRVAEQEARLKRAQAESAEQRRLADQEVRVSFQNLVHSRNARLEAQNLLNARQKSYSAQLNDYRAGRVTNLDVLTALNLLQQSELSLIESRFTEANDRARLKVASGEVEK